MPWFGDSDSYHSRSVSFSSDAIKTAISNFVENVANALIGDVADSSGTFLTHGSDEGMR